MKTARKQKVIINNLFFNIILFIGLGSSLGFSQDGDGSIVIEAEDYKSAPESIEVGSSNKASNGQFVTQFKGHNTLEYSFKADNGGTYDLSIFASNRNQGNATVNVEVNGVMYKKVAITQSFDWNVFAENKITGVALKKGKNTVTITQITSLSSRPDKLVFTPVSN